MLQSVADYLTSEGWTVVVIGSPKVQKPVGSAEFNFEFVLRLTGAPPKEEAKDVAAIT